MTKLCIAASDVYCHRAETFAVFDRRFDIFLNDCTKDMFILAYLLDPSAYFYLWRTSIN